MKINIITPCSRPGNLRAVYSSLNFPFYAWYIIFDSEEIPKKERAWLEEIPNVFLSSFEGGRLGYVQRNSVLRDIKKGFCYFLDDDTIVHPNFYERLNEIHKKLKKGIYIFGQDIGGKYPKRKTMIKPGYIDMGQYVVSCDYFKDLYFLQATNSDGVIIEHLYNSYPEDVVYIGEILSYYNKLRRKEEVK